ncbi:Uncharacterized conserved protein YeaO, DUF488 family [Nitrosomonas cryotolerans]|uniref:Uncharacterized conserved protein YeaO, DUF488 family n=1 Tax=Nitrosomonas cryotolerans ATCC 49181 TaxID=1131553 RepID=A0A1N6IZ90_9PROT|nr:DUF488 family protein [Nitrosomonas cryotolerans]SFP54651.1 Uncharacterized conserved protein YeaO, DUF488 family [Nitrosomonas cryotolerans]SIO37428.1 Uncharacterized conserved protein YeaO, DUF488 family [Nitrosomonas cryotolerans ATCC 49181]
MKKIELKRIYEMPSDSDGYRILVDRLWPRGVKKEEARLNEWNKDIAPSPELRKWFGHKSDRFEEFARHYRMELSNKAAELEKILAISQTQNVMLVYAAKDPKINHAKILLNTLLELHNHKK